jgi:hypothetical protein
MGGMGEVKGLYLSPRDPNITYDPSMQSFAMYNFHPCNFMVYPQPCDPSMLHHAFIPVSYDGPTPDDSESQLGPMLKEWIQPFWTEVKIWLHLLRPYHPTPLPFNLEEIIVFLSRSHLWDAWTWGKVHLLGLELQALSTMLMK